MGTERRLARTRAPAGGDGEPRSAVLRGVYSATIPAHLDRRGRLRAVERDDPVPFPPARVFVVSDVPPDEVRARHAVSCHELLWMLTGACELGLDNGRDATTIELHADGPAFAVSAGVWMELRRFTPGATLLVLASMPHAETRYFDGPRPELVVELRPSA